MVVYFYESDISVNHKKQRFSISKTHIKKQNLRKET